MGVCLRPNHLKSIRINPMLPACWNANHGPLHRAELGYQHQTWEEARSNPVDHIQIVPSPNWYS